MSKDDPTGRNTIYETMPIKSGNQKVELLDTNNIVGVTLISSASDVPNGRVSKTTIFGAVRMPLNVTLGGNDGGILKQLTVTVEITDDGLTISKFTPVYLTKTNQGRSGVTLESMVIMRSIPTYAESYRLSDEPGFRGKDRSARAGGAAKEEGSDYWLDKYRNG